ncbi:hypothetical protein B0H13DRAFT_164550 [Mycena leptocephala]|nr:hypothetical protein B0H13DRAFT_164550 [Mycena leptocephala]
MTSSAIPRTLSCCRQSINWVACTPVSCSSSRARAHLDRERKSINDACGHCAWLSYASCRYSVKFLSAGKTAQSMRAASSPARMCSSSEVRAGRTMGRRGVDPLAGRRSVAALEVGAATHDGKTCADGWDEPKVEADQLCPRDGDRGSLRDVKVTEARNGETGHLGATSSIFSKSCIISSFRVAANMSSDGRSPIKGLGGETRAVMTSRT